MIFISYSRKDIKFVSPLVKFLRASGNEVFFDKENLDYGTNWWETLENAIRTSKRFLLFWSQSTVESEIVSKEISTALSTPELILVPIMLDKSPLPETIAVYHGTDDFISIFEKVIKKKKRNMLLAWIIGLLPIIILIGCVNFFTNNEHSYYANVSTIKGYHTRFDTTYNMRDYNAGFPTVNLTLYPITGFNGIENQITPRYPASSLNFCSPKYNFYDPIILHDSIHFAFTKIDTSISEIKIPVYQEEKVKMTEASDNETWQYIVFACTILLLIFTPFYIENRISIRNKYKELATQL